MRGAVSVLPPYAFMAWTGKTVVLLQQAKGVNLFKQYVYKELMLVYFLNCLFITMC